MTVLDTGASLGPTGTCLVAIKGQRIQLGTLHLRSPAGSAWTDVVDECAEAARQEPSTQACRRYERGPYGDLLLVPDAPSVDHSFPDKVRLDVDELDVVNKQHQNARDVHRLIHRDQRCFGECTQGRGQL